ncbi:hypothetical protein B0T26DRAFT_755469 [Lasiosphaeria miniovina]|uniref:Uncharacterized protein n=1 Tax=Lasiosphaeria miniovina TaxID=1954250 RepID=A0AA39ZYC9_9PEZI|nr:uncharacterized protein B0T26DRAFT_755469 [Lasiosphaeria miniovina]KAK0705897.1 hypothetical protein B0T26DRAFT_755469 [Lasiosphaeria miniovina]
MAVTSPPSTPAPVAATPASDTNRNRRHIKPPPMNLRPIPKGPSNWNPPRNPQALRPIKAEPDTNLDRTMTTHAPPPTNTGTDAQGHWYPRNFTELANGLPSGPNVAARAPTVAMPLQSIQEDFGGLGSASETSASSALQKRKQGFPSPNPTPKRRQT